MQGSRKERLLTALPREDGVISVELVILLPVITLIILALLEFGNLWSVRHTLTIASREGARAGVVSPKDPNDPARIFSEEERKNWAKQTAKDAVLAFLKKNTKWTPAEDWTVPEPTVTNNIVSGSLVGGTLTVQVRTENPLLVLHKLITEIPVVAQTTMRFE
jgi:Flp pilus assembly protein TadG